MVHHHFNSTVTDFLYENKIEKRSFCDKEMYKWSSATSSTKKSSFRNIDNKIRLIGVQLFGWYVYSK